MQKLPPGKRTENSDAATRDADVRKDRGPPGVSAGGRSSGGAVGVGGRDPVCPPVKGDV